ncbi:doublecortin domain-containing protein 1-like [Megalops cyprinoides]|uniref:doublecortin domain-containing protein 1-like n=1 Tax=Megalops cyprinoides TaxID=118141 RepID=UPI001863C597|nr:doublecortin domain-containing protein 1-like [Megalops cyprinoides]
MAGERRPASTSTPSSGTSGRSQRSGWTRSSLRSSLEEALIQEYSNRFSASSRSPSYSHLPSSPLVLLELPQDRKQQLCLFPALTAAYHREEGRGEERLTDSSLAGSHYRGCTPARRYYLQGEFTTDGRPAKGPKNKDSKKRQSACVTPDPSSRSSISTRREGGRRPQSAPAPHIRSLQQSSQMVPVFKRNMAIIRVIAHKNGSRQTFARITASNITMLLEECTSKLKLISAARRIFLEDGKEVSKAEDIPKDGDVYISSGEAFVDPHKQVKAHLSLSKEANWTVGGVTLPANHGRGRQWVTLSQRLRGLSQATPTLRVLAFRNGTGSEGCEVAATVGHMEQFLDLCTQKLQLTSRAKLLYDWDGNRVEDISLVFPLDSCLQSSITSLRGPVWVSRGEWFSPAGAKFYIQGVLWALRGRLQSIGEYLRQLDLAVDNSPEKVTKKEILSLTVGQLHERKEKLQRQVGELRATIRKYRGQLSVLAPQIRAEEDRPGGYVSQHVQPLSRGPPLPQGLQLKVFVNGQDTGETLVFIRRGELDKGCEEDMQLQMERLLQAIHQRLQSRPGHSPSGPRIVPSCLFDERGEVISSPAALCNEQSVWVSYGEGYRPPHEAVLSLAFERVIAAGDGDYRALFRAPLDPDADLPAGFRKWEACEGFPLNCVSSSPGNTSLPSTVDPDAHFIQFKTDPQVVLFPSATVVNRSRTTRPKPGGEKVQGVGGSLGWPLSHVWIFTKLGLILSRALPQLCLAVSPQPFTLRDSIPNGNPVEGHMLNVQKRVTCCPYQEWGFGKDGCIFPKAHPEFVLTYLEDLPESKQETQTHHAAQAVGKQDGSVAPKVSGYSVSDTNQNPTAGPIHTLMGLAGARGDTAQLTVALLRRRKDKLPQASAQRWAIRHEGISRMGQWKHSKVENPLWNKLTYMWPTLPDGKLNQDLTWPLEGALVPCAPPLTDRSSRRPQDHVPVRLRVVRNGQQGGHPQAVTVTSPDITNMLKSRCTESLELPLAARRLFDEDGKEIFLLKDLQRDQLVYVSCGEQWVNPRVCQANKERRLLLNSLEWDVSLVRHYCAMRGHQDLVLEVVGELKEGARLTVAEFCMALEEQSKEECLDPTNQEDTGDRNDLLNVIIEDSHSKAHRKLDEKHSPFRYPWQEDLGYPEDYGIQNDNREGFTSMDLSNKHRREGASQADRQQFEYREGQIVNCRCPWLVLGVRATEGAQAGMALQLLQQNPDDTNQRWVLKEKEWTFHLLANPGLVLAVSMPKIAPGQTGRLVPVPGCPVILQKYRPYSYGAANQKWGWLLQARVLSAFYTTELDQGVTAAIHASLCTTCVSPEPLHQQELPNDSTFRCSTARKDSTLSPNGPFKSLTVLQTDLSASAAESTLCSLEERLDSLRRETQPRETTTARAQPAVKILARRNGRGLEEGQLITAVKMPLLLSQCTTKLQLPRAACRLYTSDGMQILTMQQLKAWAINKCLQEHCTNADTDVDTDKDIDADTDKVAQPTAHSSTDTGGQPGSGVARTVCPESELLPQVTTEDLDAMDKTLVALILRTPIDVWVSCGEPFLPVDVVHRKQRQQWKNWQQKEKLLADLAIKRHRMRHMQGRRISGQSPARMVPTKSPAKPVVVEGGWTVVSQEEVKLMEDLQNMEVHLAEVEAMQAKNYKPIRKKLSKSLTNLYNQPDVKRVLMYCNGDQKQAVYVWGQNIEELLSNSTSRLRLAQPASQLYTTDGEPLLAWADIERDMLICVSTGEPFLTAKDCKERVEMRASYVRMKKAHGPDGIRQEMEPKEGPLVKAPSRCLALPWTTEAENQKPIPGKQ